MVIKAVLGECWFKLAAKATIADLGILRCVPHRRAGAQHFALTNYGQDGLFHSLRKLVDVRISGILKCGGGIGAQRLFALTIIGELIGQYFLWYIRCAHVTHAVIIIASSHIKCVIISHR